MGPIETELRSTPVRLAFHMTMWPLNVFEDAHRRLSMARTGDRYACWSGCCAEAMSEAIEAAEALGL